MPFCCSLPHGKCAHVHACSAPELCGCELLNFSTFWARIPLLRTDSGPLLRGDNSLDWGPPGIHVGILGADIGPLESLLAMHFRALPHDKCAHAHAYIALSLRDCELSTFCTFWARIRLL